MKLRDHILCFSVTALMVKFAAGASNPWASAAYCLALGAYLGIRMGATPWR